MKSFQQESKYAESRQRDESQSYNNKFLDYSKSIDNKIVPNSSLYDSTPMKTYSQVSFTQGFVKGAKLCLNPYFFGWLEK